MKKKEKKKRWITLCNYLLAVSCGMFETEHKVFFKKHSHKKGKPSCLYFKY